MSSSTKLPPSVPAPPAGPEFDFVTWFEVNRKAIVVGIGVVCAVVVGLLVVRAQQRSRASQATQALLQLTPPSGPGERPAAVDPAKLLAMASQYSGTPASQQALLLAAGQLFANGQYAESQKQFAEFEAQHPDSGFVGVALLGVAAALEAQGKSTEAIAAYDRAIVSSGSDAYAAQARLAKARMLAASQPAQALTLFDEVMSGPAAGALGNQALQGRSELLSKHPELAQTASTTNTVTVRPSGTVSPAPAEAR